MQDFKQLTDPLCTIYANFYAKFTQIDAYFCQILCTNYVGCNRYAF